jgi:predicted PurR-regulated permease PerM
MPSESRSFLYLLLALLGVALVAIVLPFHGTLLWALVIALLFTPLHRRLMRRLSGRSTPAALLTLSVVVLIVVLPLVLVGVGVTNELSVLYEQVQSGQIRPETWVGRMFDSLPASVAGLLERVGVVDVQVLERRLLALLDETARFIGAGVLRYGQNTFELVASLFIMLYVVFFLLRDGARLAATLRDALPVASQHQRELLDKFSTVIRATVKGNLLVALLQGCLGGLALWVLDIRAALLLAVLMAFLSLLPAVGAALVWGPVAVYLVSDGRLAAAAGLVAWGVLVIGLVDNLLRPVLVGRDTHLPDWVVLMATLGGMAVFGINGFVMGPLIVAMFLAVWHILLPGWRETPRGRDDVVP